MTDHNNHADRPKPGMHLVHSWDTSLQESIEDTDMVFRIFRDKYPHHDAHVAAILTHSALTNVTIEVES